MLTEYLPVHQRLPEVSAFIAARLETAPGADGRDDAGARAQEIMHRLTAADVSAWAALAGGRIQAVLGAELRHITPADPEYTYMPAHYALVPLALWHLVGESAWAYMPDLLDHAARDARREGIDRLSIDIPVDDGASMAAILAAGFVPDVILAARASRPGRAEVPGGVTIRRAREADADALLALTLEEADYHAHHTASGIRPDQDPEPSRAHVRRWLEHQRTRDLPVLVAETGGRVVGMLPLMLLDDAAGLVPGAYGYIASTCVSAAARGRGIGAALVECAFDAVHRRGIRVLLLHYVADNPLAAPLWESRGFAPLTVTLTRHLAMGV